MTKVVRTVIVDGRCHRISCAVRADGTAPAWEFLEALRKGEWEHDDGLERDEQIRDYDYLMTVILYWADEGFPPRVDDAKWLRDGIWEFRKHIKRLTFYDTDGEGGYVAKNEVEWVKDSNYPDSTFWYIPYMDEEIRLGHTFAKRSQKTPDFDLAEAKRVRMEDLEHDK